MHKRATDKEAAIKRLEALLVVRRHPRFAPHIDQHYRLGVQEALNWLNGNGEVARAEDDEFACIIVDLAAGYDDPFHRARAGRHLTVQKARPFEPVASGFWMDMPEPAWRIKRRDYEKWPRERRAQREAREQVELYARKQFARLWFEFYYPQEYDEVYWRTAGESPNALTATVSAAAQRRFQSV